MRADDLSSGARAVTVVSRAFLRVALAALALLAAPPAGASEDELQVTVGPGYSALPEIGEGLDGVAGGGEVSYGFSPFWSLALGGYFGHHFPQTVDDLQFDGTNVTSVWLAPRFNLDVFVLIPFLTLGPELLVTRGELNEGQAEVDAGLRATLGFDYRPSRLWSVGFEVGWHALLTDPLDYPTWVTSLLRVSLYHDFGAL